jgi:Fe-S-cluster containining protein
MEDLLQSLPQIAQQKKKENTQFFKDLRKKKPKGLDQLAVNIHNEVFDTIDCLDCANCCKTTGPLFTNIDIDRIAKHFKMRPSDFIDQYLRVDEDKDYVLQQTPCHFLGTDNHCSIYKVRPKACKEFPHTDRKKIYQIGNITVKNTAICPAAYQIVERMKDALT